MTVTSAKRELRVFHDLGELSRAAADFVSQVAGESVQRSGEFFVGLSGGSTPRRLYEILGSHRDRSLPWPRTQLFWSDERCVPPDDPQSNYRMVTEALSAAPIPPPNVHRMRGEDPPEEAAREYENELRQSFQIVSEDVPRFDLILLGLGEDGHTASLFPGNPVLEDTAHLVAAPYVEKLKAYRLTLTLPVLNNAANVAFLVAGSGKRAILKRVLEEQPGVPALPAQRVRPSNGRLLWFVDESAACDLQL
jgi:6-phosphogluconolactonase